MKKITTTCAIIAVSASTLAPFAVFAEEQTTAGVSVESSTTMAHDEVLLPPLGNKREGIIRMRLGADATTTRPERLYESSSTQSENHDGKTMMHRDPANRAGNEIANRIEALNRLSVRINAEVRLTSEQKSGITATINATVSDLTALNIKIAADTDPAILAADKALITKANRVYALVIPQAAIMASADRELSVVVQMQALGTKLAARISKLEASSTDATAEKAAYADFQIKVALAQTSANAAASGVTGLKPDNGDAAIATSNRAALKSAREQLKAGEIALKAARADIRIITGRIALKGQNSENNQKPKLGAEANGNAALSSDGSARQ